jgi:hypothetical protein
VNDDRDWSWLHRPQSTVYRGSDDPALHTMSEGTRQNFVGHGWTLVS